VLDDQGRAAEAEQEFREAIRLRPDLPEAHYNLGLLLARQNKLAEAEREYREALRLRSDSAEAHFALGNVLRVQGRFLAALAEMRRGHELGSRQRNWPYPSAQLVEQIERLAALDAALPAVLSGEAEPADAAAQLGLAQLCQLPSERRYATSARWHREVFAAQPALANDLSSGSRYDAACAAALAGCGQGIDAPAGEAERSRLRAQAREWLRADLSARTLQTASWFAGIRAEAVQALHHWKEDPDLAGVRDADALEKLPERERADWRKLWADVDALLPNTP
jgi:hypothetical protein